MASSDMQDVKRRITSITSMEHITNAMKLVSAAKLRRAKTTFENTNENFKYITKTIASIFANTGKVPEKYIKTSVDPKKVCFIVMTSNRGLCGGFNSSIIKAAEKHIDEVDGEVSIVAIGSKGLEYFKKRNKTIISKVVESSENITFEQTSRLVRPLVKGFEEGEFDRIELIYTKYFSPLKQEVKMTRLLPFDLSDFEGIDFKETEYGPSPEKVFDYLVPKYVEIYAHGAIVESATCEHAARRIAMDNATDNARDMLDNLSLYYNRARQAAITDEIIEIVAGSEAQK